MPEYQYMSLSVERRDIRLLTLLPGKYNDAICFDLVHRHLIPPETVSNSKRLSIKELQNTLQSDWTVYETLEGRYLLYQNEIDTGCWVHPDPNYDHELYKPSHEDPDPDYEPKYEALSYTWGSMQDPETAYVQDSPTLVQDTEKTLETLLIGHNLACALRHLRYPNATRTLWVDALCINQKDEKERNDQVKRMGLIYKLASRVIVWLGPEEKNSKLSISTMQNFGQMFEYSVDNWFLRSPDSSTELHWFDPNCELPYDEETWLALTAFFSRPWFCRLWVFQEIQLANKNALVLCGHDEILWYHLRRAILMMYQKIGIPQELKGPLQIANRTARRGIGASLEELLATSAERQCTDPRDKLYGILSIAPPLFASRIQPNYSLSATEVYKDAFLTHLHLVNRLDVLRLCKLEGNQDKGPSWLPNWFAPGNIAFQTTSGNRAAGLSQAQVQYTSPNILNATGVQYATICTVSNPISGHTEDAINTIHEWEPEGLLTAEYITGGTLLDAYLSVLRLNSFKDRYPVSHYTTLQVCREAYLRHDRESATLGTKSMIGDIRVDWLRGASFATTDEGYIGLVPSTAQPSTFQEKFVKM